MTARYRESLLALALAGAVSCGDGLGPAPELDGQWIGETAGIELRLVLAEDNGTVEGYAYVHNGGFTGAELGFTRYPIISGHYFQHRVLVTLPESDYSHVYNPARTFQGILRDSTITGTLTTPHWDMRLPITLELRCRIPGGCG